MKNPLIAMLVCLLILLAGRDSKAQIGPVNDSAVVGSPYINAQDTAQKAGDTEGPALVRQKPRKNDTSAMVKHSPRRATLLSAFLPGTGQIYNKKYWKVPLVYVAAGAAVYGVVFYSTEYSNFRDAYRVRLATGTNEDPYYAQFQNATLQSYRDYYRYYRDMSYIALGAVYVLQVVDAAVDAHFYDFKITEDLSLNWQPVVDLSGPLPSSRLLFTLKF